LPPSVRRNLGKRWHSSSVIVWGGVCLNWGCIPTKALLKNANVVETIRHADDFGIQVERFTADFGKAIERSRLVSQYLVDGLDLLMLKNKITVVKGEAVLTARDRIEVKPEGKVLTAPNIIIATGARALSIPGLPIDGQWVITSRHALAARDLPRKLSLSARVRLGWSLPTSIVRTAPR